MRFRPKKFHFKIKLACLGRDQKSLVQFIYYICKACKNKIKIFVSTNVC